MKVVDTKYISDMVLEVPLKIENCIAYLVSGGFSSVLAPSSVTIQASLSTAIRKTSSAGFPLESGNKLDNIHDHLIAVAMLKKEIPDIAIPFNGNLWLKEQVDLLYESDVKIARVRTLNALDLFFNKIA